VHHLLLRNPRNFCGGATVLPSERAIWKDLGLLASRISDSCSGNKFFTQEVWKKDQSLTANLGELSFIMLQFWAMHSVEKQGFQSGETAMNAEETALILIGFQNDYFAPDGILHHVIDGPAQLVANTVDLVERLSPSPVLIIDTPVIFTAGYGELVEPVGILKMVKEAGAFRAGTQGAETIAEIRQFSERVVEVPGKRGLNAFSNTDLDNLLKKRGIKNVVLAGVATPICVESTGRSAYERGYRVFILSDCTSGRTKFEQSFYCEKIFPLYAEVIDHTRLLSHLEETHDADRQ